MSRQTTIAKEILLDELHEQTHPIAVEQVIFWALEHYAHSAPRDTMGRVIAYAIAERIKEDSNKTEQDKT